MKHIIAVTAAISAILALCLLFACGAPTDEDLEQLELEQATLGVRASTNYGLRSDIASPNEAGQCAPPTSAPATHACNYPGSRAIKIRCGTGFTADELSACNALIPEKVETLTAQLGEVGWTFAMSTIGSNCIMNKGTVSGSGGSADMRRYVAIVPSGVGASMPEPAGGYPGTYRQWTTLSGTMDWAKLDSDFSTASGIQRSRARQHAMNMVLAACVGIGWRTDAPTRWNNSSIDLVNPQATTFANDDKCRANHWSPTGGGATLLISTGC